MLGYRPVGLHHLTMVDTMLNPVLDPTGFRQLLNYLYKVRKLLCVSEKPLTRVK